MTDRGAFCFAMLAIGLVAQGSQRPAPSVKTLTTAASAYVADYETRFAFLIADEDYSQQTLDAGGQQTGQRTTHGELFLTFLPADRQWIAVHDVADVDGQPVTDREDLRALLQRGSIIPVAQRVADRNARFNIGSVTRNFNEPTLGLLVLEAKRASNFKFGIARAEPESEPPLVTLAFTERDRPTLVKSTRGQAIFATGEVTIAVDTGAVRRTRLQFVDGPVRATLTTDYTLDARLGLWVPSVFTERYELTRRDVGDENIACEARYTNYRRFEVTARIK
jgi:hypothetical protein